MRTLLVAALLAAIAHPVLAASDPAIGKKLVEDSKCELCHHNLTMGDAKAVYLRKDRKVISLAKLKAQVALCSSQLNIGLFPEDEDHITAYLNETYYKFTVK